MLVGISNAEDQETGQPEMCVWMGEGGSPPLDRFGYFYDSTNQDNVCCRDHSY